MEKEKTRRTRTEKQTALIPLFTGRPERTTAINGDDIANLTIALHTAKTLEEFLLLV